jgi:hypothetical protein
MIVTMKPRYFIVLFILIFATVDLWIMYPQSPFYTVAIAIFTSGYIIHEPAHAIVARLCDAKEISVMLGGYTENWVEFEETDPKKLILISGIGAVVQAIQCITIVFAAIVFEWNNITYIPSIIAIFFMVLFLIDSKIPHSDLSRAISWMNSNQEV